MVARPRKTAKRDYSHQIKKNKNVYVLYFFDCLYEKDYEVRLLTPDSKEKKYLYSFSLESPA